MRLYNWFFKPRIIERKNKCDEVNKYSVAKHRGPFTVLCSENFYYCTSDRWRKSSCCCFKECFYSIDTAKQILAFINIDYVAKDFKEYTAKVPEPLDLDEKEIT